MQLNMRDARRQNPDKDREETLKQFSQEAVV
jgi:hypothetical protein